MFIYACIYVHTCSRMRVHARVFFYQKFFFIKMKSLYTILKFLSNNHSKHVGNTTLFDQTLLKYRSPEKTITRSITLTTIQLHDIEVNFHLHQQNRLFPNQGNYLSPPFVKHHSNKHSTQSSVMDAKIR